MRPTTMIQNATVFDGERVLYGQNVAWQDGLITSVGPGPVPGADEVIDGRGRTLLPGLIDACAHLNGHASNLREALAFGVTTELDMFDFPPARVDEMRAAGTRPGHADLRCAGTIASAAHGSPGRELPWLPTLAGPQEADKFVEARDREGSDYLVIALDDGGTRVHRLPELDRETVFALLAAARRRNLHTVARISRLWSMELALAAGVDVLAHLPRAGEPVNADLATRLAADHRSVIPVLARAWPDSLDAARRSVATLHTSGVRVLAGSSAARTPELDDPVAHGDGLHHELGLLVSAGLTPIEALAAATSAPADAFRLPDRGRVQPGLRADLVLVDGNPAADITATRRITHVWRSGAESRTAVAVAVAV